MNIQLFVQKSSFIIQTFALRQYEPIKFYRFSLSFIFQANIQHGHHLHTILTSYLQSPSGCLGGHALISMCNLCPQKIFSPKAIQKLKKLCFCDLVTILGNTCTNFFSQSLGPLQPYFLFLRKTLRSCVALSPNLSLKTHLCEKAVFFLLQVGILLSPLD